MNLVPALAEQHAAHKARMARMGCAPLRPVVCIPEKQPVDLKPRSKLTPQQRAAAIRSIREGMSYSQVARLFSTTGGVIAGIVRRAGGRNG